MSYRVAGVGLLLSSLCVACGGRAASPAAAAPSALRVVSGAAQAGVVGQELPIPILVRVVDAQERPLQGQLVNFRVTGGGGSVFVGASISNADGIVQDRWTLGTNTLVAQTLEARAVDNATGAPIVFASVSATAAADAPSAIGIVAGDGQQAGIAATGALPQPLVVQVSDQFGNPAPGVEVAWVPTAGDGVAQVTSSTGADGQASTTWTLGAEAGDHTLRAVSGTLQAQFTASRGSKLVLTAVCGMTSDCSFAARCASEYTGEITFDASQALGLWLPVQVENRNPDNADPSSGRVNTNDAVITSFEITFEGFGLVSATARLASRVPAGGTAVLRVEVVPAQASLVAAPIGTAQALARVVGKGYRDDGVPVTTDEFQVAFTYCEGCVSYACGGSASPIVTCGELGTQPVAMTCTGP